MEKFGWQFRIGDKVIQTENNYDKEVFNGDIGIVTLAGGHRVAIAAFLAGSTGTQAQRDALFADSARLVVAAFH